MHHASVVHPFGWHLPRKRRQARQIEHLHASVRYPDQTFMPQVLQRAVDMHRAQTQRVAEYLLRRRHLERFVASDAQAFEAPIDVEQETCHALARELPAEPDDLLHMAKFLPAFDRLTGLPQSWEALALIEWGNERIGRLSHELAEGEEGRRRPRAGARREPHHIAGQVEIDDLPPAVHEVHGTVGPAGQ